MSFQNAIEKKAIEIGKLSVEITTSAGSGSPGLGSGDHRQH